METNTGDEKYFLSWDRIEEMCVHISEDIQKRNVKIDKIIAVSRGGLIPARILSSLLNNKNLFTIRVTFYTKPGVTKDKPHLAEDLSTDVTDKNVLVVDDVVESGKTLALAQNYLRERGAKKVFTAALLDKYVDGKEKAAVPDFFCEKIDNKWIVYPWEKFEKD